MRHTASLLLLEVHMMVCPRRGYGGFDAIGSDHERAELSLEHLMSYDEMAISALVSVGGPTQFVNTGDRYNRGRLDEEGTFVPHGVYVGCVGARFERRNKMEWQHMIVSKDQNVPEKGYGPPGAANYRPSVMLQAWAKLYGMENFPLYSEVLEQEESSQTRFRRLQYSGNFLDRQVRMARPSVSTLVLYSTARLCVSSC